MFTRSRRRSARWRRGPSWTAATYCRRSSFPCGTCSTRLASQPEPGPTAAAQEGRCNGDGNRDAARFRSTRLSPRRGFGSSGKARKEFSSRAEDIRGRMKWQRHASSGSRFPFCALCIWAETIYGEAIRISRPCFGPADPSIRSQNVPARTAPDIRGRRAAATQVVRPGVGTDLGLRCMSFLVATGWSDPVAGWELHPLKINTFLSRRTRCVSFSVERRSSAAGPAAKTSCLGKP
jgi:hypothetical protein